VEGSVQAKARVNVTRELVGLGDDRFERCSNERIAVGLATGEGARIAAEEWQVRGKFLTKRHFRIFSLETRIGAVFERAGGLLQPWKDRSNAKVLSCPQDTYGWNKGPGIWFPSPGRACCTADIAAQ